MLPTLQTFSVAGHSGDRTCRESPAVDQGHEDPQGIQGELQYILESAGASGWFDDDTPPPPAPPPTNWRARICKRLRSPGIDSNGGSIPLAYVSWRAGTSIMVLAPARQAGNRFLGSLKDLQIRVQDSTKCFIKKQNHRADNIIVLRSTYVPTGDKKKF